MGRSTVRVDGADDVVDLAAWLAAAEPLVPAIRSTDTWTGAFRNASGFVGEGDGDGEGGEAFIVAGSCCVDTYRLEAKTKAGEVAPRGGAQSRSSPFFFSRA